MLSLGMIVQNETGCLDRCLASIHKFVDEIVVVWNGTNEDTKKILDKYNCKIIKKEWTGKFDEMRQASFDACSNPYILWLDADDTFENGIELKELMSQFQDHRLGALWMYYDYERILI